TGLSSGMEDERSESSQITARVIKSVFIVHLLASLRYAVFFERLSKRYTIVLIVLTMCWAAVGLYLLARKIKSKSDILVARNLWIGVALTLLIFSFYTFRPLRYVKAGEKDVGHWIKKNHAGSAPPVILSDSNRIPYYAGGTALFLRGVGMAGKDYDQLISYARTNHTDYLVLDSKMDNYFPGFTQAIQPGDLKLVYTPALQPTQKEFKVFRVLK
ncbi:MAG: hypothetical protein KAI63_02585, partial [Planctomycetes bacterium]|nr:hypothetical protein [Planctomycetota bacterium]